jgi:hypothetical protein
MNCPLLHFEAELHSLIDTVKLLLYKRHPLIFERIDFENDEIFQEPLLYAYLIQSEDKWLDSIIFGYEKVRKTSIQVYTNKQGVLYIPCIGYFKTKVPSAVLTLSICGDSYLLINGQSEPVNYEFEPIFFLREEFELMKTQHPLLENLFHDEEEKVAAVEIDTIYDKYIAYCNNAIEVIKSHYPEYFALLHQNVKKVMIFEGVPNSFAAIQAHNMIFFSAHPADDEIFFLDHFLHEGSHVVFNTLTFRTKERLFKIPYKSPLSAFTGNSSDSGELYGRFHGLFTQSMINPGMEICLNKRIFDGKKRIELLGRFSSNIKRFGLAIERFNIPDMYLEEGSKWYQFFSDRYKNLYTTNKDLVNQYDVSNQPYIFSYKIFIDTNDIK